MKKLSSFLAAVMLFVMVATAMGTTETAMAFSKSDYSSSDFIHWSSGKAGTEVGWWSSLDEDKDITGWKAAICPADNLTLEAAVCTKDLTNENKVMSGYIPGLVTMRSGITASTILQIDLNGEYCRCVFDADGKLVNTPSRENFVTKELVSSSISLEVIGNNGYVYIYTYSDSASLNADSVPVLYGLDQTTPLTSADRYMTINKSWGDTLHIWRLKVLDNTQVKEGEYLYYKFDSDVLGLNYSNTNGLSIACVDNPERWGAEQPVDPFEQNNTGSTAPTVPTNTVTGSGNAGASVSGVDSILPNGTTFAASQLTEGTDYDTTVAVANANFGAGAIYSVFKMDLADANGVAITQLADFVKVSLPIPATLTVPAGKTIVVYRCEENGTLTRCNTTVTDGVVTFETNHFSNYILNVENAPDSSLAGADTTQTKTEDAPGSSLAGAGATPKSPKTGDVNMVFPAMVMILSAAGITFMGRKKHMIQ